jgi:beta-mannosidase
MYVNNYTGVTLNLTRFSYLSQVMQAYALELAISSLRGSKPFNMGSLYWQLNDVWPVSSWATIDYHQIKKAAHYSIKKLYEPLLFNCYEPFSKNSSNSSYKVNIINDYK